MCRPTEIVITKGTCHALFAYDIGLSINLEGEIATYRPRTARQSRRLLEVPVARAGAFGLARTDTQPIQQGLDARDIDAGKEERPPREFHVLCDAHGIVRVVRH